MYINIKCTKKQGFITKRYDVSLWHLTFFRKYNLLLQKLMSITKSAVLYMLF